MAILQEGEAGVPVAEILRKHGISRPAFYLWKTKYGGAGVLELQRLKALEQENARPNSMYADMAIENGRSRTCSAENCRASVRRADVAIVIQEHDRSVVSACHIDRLSRTAHYLPPGGGRYAEHCRVDGVDRARGTLGLVEVPESIAFARARPGITSASTACVAPSNLNQLRRAKKRVPTPVRVPLQASNRWLMNLVPLIRYYFVRMVRLTKTCSRML